MFLIDDMVNAWSTERTNEQAAINAKAQRDWQEKMWHLNNAYNDPSAQKARLEAAGINPYSVMAEGGADTGNSSSPADSVPPAPVSRYEMSNNVGFDILQALKTSKEIEGQNIANRSAETNLAFQETEKLLGIMETRAKIRKLISSKDVDEAYKDYLRTQDALLEGQANSILRKSRAEANQADTISQNLQREYDDAHNESVARQAVDAANVRVSNAQVKQIGALIGKVYNEIALLVEQKNLTKSEIKKVISEKLLSDENRKVLSARNEREAKSLRLQIANELFEMLTESRTTQFGAIGRWKFGSSADNDFLQNDLVPFINDGSYTPPRLEKIKPRSGIR